MSRAKSEYRYEKLTWPEINDAVDLGKVCIILTPPRFLYQCS